MILSLFVVPTGHHEASWRLGESPAERMYDFEYYSDLASMAESAGLHCVFFADAPALRTNIRYNTGGSVLEPFTLAGGLIARTESIGIVVTASTTYSDPYNTARALSSLDHLSNGRIGWNMVTTAFAPASRNFGADGHPSRSKRYERADEFVAVAKGLWDSWRPGAITCDRESGIYVDASQVRELSHVGRTFRVAGPFQAARSPQRWPVLVQAGASEPGRKFGARHAEVLFSVQRKIDGAVQYRKDVRRRASAFGRDPKGILSLPGLSVFVAPTRREAEHRVRELDRLVIPEYGVSQILKVTGVDLSHYGLDDEVTPEALTRTLPGNSMSTRRDEIISIAKEERHTLRTLLGRIACARTHRVVVGTPTEVADTMEEWLRAGACDGFNLMPPVLPSGIEEVRTLLLPELSRRGLWSRPSRGHLRERLGLPPLNGI